MPPLRVFFIDIDLASLDKVKWTSIWDYKGSESNTKSLANKIKDKDYSDLIGKWKNSDNEFELSQENDDLYIKFSRENKKLRVDFEIVDTKGIGAFYGVDENGANSGGDGKIMGMSLGIYDVGVKIDRYFFCKETFTTEVVDNCG